MDRILLAEEGVRAMSLGSALLTDPEIELDAVTDGRSALERLTQSPNYYDLVILGYDLAEISGTECIRFVRQMVGRLPVVVITDERTEACLRELAELGVPKDSVVARTDPPETVARHVKNALSKHRREG